MNSETLRRKISSAVLHAKRWASASGAVDAHLRAYVSLRLRRETLRPRGKLAMVGKILMELL